MRSRFAGFGDLAGQRVYKTVPAVGKGSTSGGSSSLSETALSGIAAIRGFTWFRLVCICAILFECHFDVDKISLFDALR
jgi:hypothetical protein